VSACVSEREHANTRAHCQRIFPLCCLCMCPRTNPESKKSNVPPVFLAFLRALVRMPSVLTPQASAHLRALKHILPSTPHPNPPRPSRLPRRTPRPLHRPARPTNVAPHAISRILCDQHHPAETRTDRSLSRLAYAILHTLALAASSGDDPPLTSQGLAAARPPRSSRWRARGICARSVATSVMYTCVRVSISCIYTKQMHAYEQAHVCLCRPECRWL